MPCTNTELLNSTKVKMFKRKFKKLATYWCIRLLTSYGFPRKAFAQINNQQYCNYYPYLYTDEISKDNDEFAASLRHRHKTTQKLFSLSNFSLIISAIHVACAHFLFLISSGLFIAICMGIVNQVIWGIITTLIFCLAYIFFVFGKVHFYNIYEEYSSILCILETTYICKELDNANIFVDNSSSNSVKRRIKNISKLIYIHGKVSKDKHGYYGAMSMDIFNKIDWLNRPINTTLEDLKSYFEQIKYYWIIGHMGEIKIDNALSKQKPKWIKMSNFLDKSFEFAEKLLSLLERAKKLFTGK